SFMGSLQPHLEIDGCLFTHVEPWLDPHTVEDLWSFHGPPDSPEKLARSFAATRQRVLFIGHLHRWLLGRRTDCCRGAGTSQYASTPPSATWSSSMPSGTGGLPCSTRRPTSCSRSGKPDWARKQPALCNRESRGEVAGCWTCLLGQA